MCSTALAVAGSVAALDVEAVVDLVAVRSREGRHAQTRAFSVVTAKYSTQSNLNLVRR